MNHQWLENLEVNLNSFIDNLKKDKKYTYFPVLKNKTKFGYSGELGFTCFVLKIFYITNRWENLSNLERKEWISFINSFQSDDSGFPINSYIDLNYLEEFNNPVFTVRFKNILKVILKKLKLSKRLTREEYLHTSIKAESKQAISTIYQVGYRNDKRYTDFPTSRTQIHQYLESLNWTKPWDAGAQFSSLCLFTQTQLEDGNLKEEAKKELVSYINNLADDSTGSYFKGSVNSQKEIINGAMKVISGLDWIDEEIKYPEKLIDYCLKTKPDEDGCDLVDITYVLHMCLKQSNYKQEEVKNYYSTILDIIKNHSYHNGGFSYFGRKSQTHYYGVEISTGENEPDLHGTVLLVWAISMISQHISLPTSHWRVLKP